MLLSVNYGRSPWAKKLVLRRMRWVGRRAAAIYGFIATAKLNDIDPQAWLAGRWRAYRITLPSASTNCCLGIGSLKASLAPFEGDQPFQKAAKPRAFAGCVL